MQFQEVWPSHPNCQLCSFRAKKVSSCFLAFKVRMSYVIEPKWTHLIDLRRNSKPTASPHIQRSTECVQYLLLLFKFGKTNFSLNTTYYLFDFNLNCFLMSFVFFIQSNQFDLISQPDLELMILASVMQSSSTLWKRARVLNTQHRVDIWGIWRPLDSWKSFGGISRS